MTWPLVYFLLESKYSLYWQICPSRLPCKHQKDDLLLEILCVHTPQSPLYLTRYLCNGLLNSCKKENIYCFSNLFWKETFWLSSEGFQWHCSIKILEYCNKIQLMLWFCELLWAGFWSTYVCSGAYSFWRRWIGILWKQGTTMLSSWFSCLWQRRLLNVYFYVLFYVAASGSLPH